MQRGLWGLVVRGSLAVATAAIMEARWTPEPFEADDGRVPFRRFIEDLSDFKFVALDTAITHVLAVRGMDLVRTEWLKALGQGLHEFRVRHEADEVARMFGVDPPGVEAPREKVLLRRTVDMIWAIPHTGGRRCRNGAHV